MKAGMPDSGTLQVPLDRPAAKAPFRLVLPWGLAGDQPAAAAGLLGALQSGERHTTFRGVTGSGKTVTMAKVIAEAGRPALVLAHNKTLAAQLYGEFKEFFPKNEVEYFVSYYDYYQPEAYIARSDTYIEKDSSRNEEIDKMRHAATRALFERRDVIIVASVTCIYGLGAPVDYGAVTVRLNRGERVRRDTVLRRLVDIQYERTNSDLTRGKFRVRGDTLEVQPAYEDLAVRVEFFGDDVERITELDPLSGEVLADRDKIDIYPARHFVTPREKLLEAIKDIEAELEVRLKELEEKGRLLEAQRLGQRTRFDLEMMRETGTCAGIENYSRHLARRPAGSRPWTLLDYFPPDFLMFIDESHMSIPQARGMFFGDKARKDILVEYGFRLPSALDNRPLTFKEFEDRLDQTVFLSATPRPYEIERVEILRDLRLGVYDVVVGVNLLREGIDLPEVTLVAILDADKEGYLRSEGSLIQVIGRAARHLEGRVIMYADRRTASMDKAIDETDRRREIQVQYNTAHGIEPQTIVKAIRDIGFALRDVAEVEGIAEKAKRPIAAGEMPKDELTRLIKDIESQMKQAAKELEFERAAALRDEVVELRGLLVLERGPESLDAAAEPVRTTSRGVRAGGRRRRGP